jgi:stage II sporulation protein AA (anti-sigma F factor antagonist)
MAMPSSRAWVEVQQVGPVTVVRLKPRGVLEEETAQLIGDQIASLVEEKGYKLLVLNLGPVESMNSLMLGKIINLHRRAEEAGGRLAFCHLHARLKEVFETFKLPRLLHIYDTEQEALASFTEPQDRTDKQSSSSPGG